MLELPGFGYKGRPTLSNTIVVPSFVSTFANLSMSVFSPASMYNLPAGATRNVPDRPAVVTSPIFEQTFVAGLVFWPVPG